MHIEIGVSKQRAQQPDLLLGKLFYYARSSCCCFPWGTFRHATRPPPRPTVLGEMLCHRILQKLSPRTNFKVSQESLDWNPDIVFKEVVMNVHLVQIKGMAQYGGERKGFIGSFAFTLWPSFKLLTGKKWQPIALRRIRYSTPVMQPANQFHRWGT